MKTHAKKTSTLTVHIERDGFGEFRSVLKMVVEIDMWHYCRMVNLTRMTRNYLVNDSQLLPAVKFHDTHR